MLFISKSLSKICCAINLPRNKNLFSKMTSRTNTNLNFWDNAHKNKETPWHKSAVNPILEKHFVKLTENRNGLKFFFPLCGKSLDMLWVYNYGHEVVGIEYVQSVCEEFFNENSIKYEAQALNGLNLFKSLDGRIRLYQGDFFNFKSDFECDFDCVWDRGSLVAINSEKREKYAENIQSLLSSDFRYMVETYNYDPADYAGPPHAVFYEDIQKLFGVKCSIEKIDEYNYRPFSEAQTDKFPKAEVYLMKPQ